MNVRLRDFSMLGYLMAVLEKIEETEDDKLRWRACKLKECCIKTVKNYPGGKINKREIKRINKQVEFIIEKTFCIGCIHNEKEKTKAISALSMVLCIMDEIFENAKNKWYVDSFSDITKKIVWLFTYIDPRYEYYEFYKNGDRLYNELNRTF